MHIHVRPNTSAACRYAMQKKSEHSLTKKSLPGACNFEIKNMSSHSALVAGTRKGTRKCRAERRTSAVVFTAGKLQSFLSFPLNQKTSSSKGGRIRGAPQWGERKSGFSNPDGVFRGTTITAEMRPACIEDQPGVRVGQFALVNSLHVHGGVSSKLGGLVRV